TSIRACPSGARSSRPTGRDHERAAIRLLAAAGRGGDGIGRRAERRRIGGGGRGAGGVAGRGSLVDLEAASPSLLRARPRRRAQRGGLLRAGRASQGARALV